MKQFVTIGDASHWHFVNGRWQDVPEQELAVPKEILQADGNSMQGVHYAFQRALCYRDCTVEFEFLLQPHSDVGIALRARDEAHFHLVHFPCCGQACRAQHFWAAVSAMGDNGYLKLQKLEMLRRVPSTVRIWLRASIRLIGSNLQVRVGDYGFFETPVAQLPEMGHIGFFLYGMARIRNVSINGEASAKLAWQDGPNQAKNWFHPIVEPQRTWHQPTDLKRLPTGDLMLLFNSTLTPEASESALAVPRLTRSNDGGKSWSDPFELQFVDETSAWSGPRLQVTPKGRLITVLQGNAGAAIRESLDEGVTWSPPINTNLPLGRLFLPPQALLNLSDGAMLAFPYGRIGKALRENVWTWGAEHLQAFCCRSDDDGRTWSDPVNIDTPLVTETGVKVDGNLDLTEVSAIELKNGRVLALVRPMSSPWMWETWSDDGGRSWGACVRGPFPGYAAPNMVRTRNGAILMAHRLPELAVHCSRDDGVTWDQGTTIDSGLWAMGGMIEVEPDVVLYVYWDSFYSFMRAQFIRVDPSELVPIRI